MLLLQGFKVYFHLMRHMYFMLELIVLLFLYTVRIYAVRFIYVLKDNLSSSATRVAVTRV